MTCRAVLTPAVAVSPWVTLLISAGNALSSWAPHVLDATSLFTGLTIAVMPLYGLMIARPRDPLVRGGGEEGPGPPFHCPHPPIPYLCRCTAS